MSYQKELTFGLDFGDLGVKVMQLKRTKGSIKVAHFGEGTLEEGLLAQGEVKDMTRLAKRLKEIIGEAHIGAHHVVAALPETKTFSKLITVPASSKEQLETDIKGEVAKHVPLSFEEVWWDMDIVERSVGKLTALVGVAPRTLVEAYVKLLRSCGLTPVALDLEILAIARAALPAEIKPETVTLIADLGATKSTLILTKGNVVQMSADLGIAAEKKPAAAAYVEKLAPACARLLEAIALTETTSPSVPVSAAPVEGAPPAAATPSAPAAPATPPAPAVTLLLSGGGAALAGLPEALKALNFEVRLADPWARFGGAAQNIAAPTRFTTVIGLALYALELDRL